MTLKASAGGTDLVELATTRYGEPAMSIKGDFAFVQDWLKTGADLDYFRKGMEDGHISCPTGRATEKHRLVIGALMYLFFDIRNALLV